MSPSHTASLPSGDTIRVRPMKILVMGMGRTGTTSLAVALTQLGFKPYDWSDRLDLGHQPLWDAALRAKFYGEGKPWGRREFDHVTKDFDCILDTPCCFLAEELMNAYPDAKIILNYRDPQKWLTSMNDSIFKIHQWPCWKLLRYTDPSFVGAIVSHNWLTWDIFCDNEINDREKCLRRYQEHYGRVRQVVPKERLLEWQVAEGWEGLCEFLGVERPGGVFPRINDREEMVRNHVRIRNEGVFRSCVNGVSYGAVVWASLLVWWIWWA